MRLLSSLASVSVVECAVTGLAETGKLCKEKGGGGARVHLGLVLEFEGSGRLWGGCLGCGVGERIGEAVIWRNNWVGVSFVAPNKTV